MRIETPTEEIPAIRRVSAAKFENDVKRIGDDTRRMQRESGRTYIRLPRRQPQARRTADKTVQQSGEDGVTQ